VPVIIPTTETTPEESGLAEGGGQHPAEIFKGEHFSPQWAFSFLDTTRIEKGELIVPVKLESELATQFSELHMIVNDLSFSLDSFNEAHKIGVPDSENLHSKALIFSAVVAYARPFKTGVRQVRISSDYFSTAAGFSIEAHDYLIAMRDKHIAHSVNEFEKSAATGIMVGTPQTKWRPAGVGVTTQHYVGISKRIIEQAIIQISGMIEVLNARIDEIRPVLFQEFLNKFQRDGRWEMAPIATLPDRKNAQRRRPQRNVSAIKPALSG
jgi:hypothetical protein